MSEKIRGSRIEYFDLLNIISCFAVVVLHMNSNSWSYENTVAWRQVLSAEVLFYFAVPVFFMLTGATLIGYRNKYSTKEFLKKRGEKIIISYIAWSAFYYVVKLVINNSAGGFKTLLKRLQHTRRNLFLGFASCFHYLSMPSAVVIDCRHQI